MIALARTFVLFAPLLVAAALSAFVIRFDWWKRLRVPVDLGVRIRGRRLFGESKTLRGFVTAMVGCVIGVAIERALRLPGWLCVVDYRRIDLVIFGSLLGLGAMLGELPNSFVKRQLGIAPGSTARGPSRALFYVWDQIDLLTGAWPVVACWVRPTFALVAASVVLVLAIHPCVALVGFAVGARQTAR